jgi:hypothetical protein
MVGNSGWLLHTKRNKLATRSYLYRDVLHFRNLFTVLETVV